MRKRKPLHRKAPVQRTTSSNAPTARSTAANLSAFNAQYRLVNRSPRPDDLLMLHHAVGNKAASRLISDAVMMSGVNQKEPGPLSPTQVTKARGYYARRPDRYTPDIIARIQEAVGVQPTGVIDAVTVQGVAKWQAADTGHPRLKVDGMAGPRTLPAMIRVGLAKQSSMDQYIEDARMVNAKWEQMTPQQRGDSMVAQANKRLTALGVPIIKDVKLDTGNFFLAKSWTMELKKMALSTPKLNPDLELKFVATVYHESRHAQQFFMMAQMLANKGMTAKQITQHMKIDEGVAEEAVDRRKELGPMETVQATGWYESIYGKMAWRQPFGGHDLPEETDAHRIGFEVGQKYRK